VAYTAEFSWRRDLAAVAVGVYFAKEARLGQVEHQLRLEAESVNAMALGAASAWLFHW